MLAVAVVADVLFVTTVVVGLEVNPPSNEPNEPPLLSKDPPKELSPNEPKPPPPPPPVVPVVYVGRHWLVWL